MINSEKRGEERSCNCRNSKCMKLYCECFSARVPCRNTCHCVDCQNSTVRDLCRQSYLSNKRISRQELIRTHKGCACRRSGCTKKYCECFQSGLLCKETCKCVDCQNNESLTNRKVINQLRKRTSDISNRENGISLYPLYLSQNSQHLNSIIAQSNPLSLQENWLENCARVLYESGRTGKSGNVMDKLIQILSKLEQEITQQQHLGFQEEEFSSQMGGENDNIDVQIPPKKIKFQQSQNCDHVNINEQNKQYQQKKGIYDDEEENEIKNEIIITSPKQIIRKQQKIDEQKQKLIDEIEIKDKQQLN